MSQHTVQVTSQDGVTFSVTFHARTDAQAKAAERVERDFVGRMLACQLDGFDDYTRVVRSMDDLTGLGFVWAPAPAEAAPPAPPRQRPVLTLIKGGKS